MLKPLALAVLLAAGQPAIAATSWSYDFSGTLADHFDQVLDGPAPSTASQANGALVFHTQGAVLASTDELFVYKHFMPTYQQSWTAQIDAMVPASLDAQTGTGEFYVSAALYAVTTNPDGSIRQGMQIGLESNPPGGHQYWAGTWGDAFVGDQPTGDVAGTIGLSFDAATKVLSAHSTHGTLLSVDIDDPASNWGMAGGDHFFIVVGFDSAGMSVAETEAMTLDNFSATLQPVPEPETYALMLAGLGLVGLAAWRNRV